MIVKRLPFTLFMLICVAGVGVSVGGALQSLEPEYRRSFGSSLQTLLRGDAMRLITSLFLTAGGWRYFASVLMLGACVGWAEWTRGTMRTVGVFFGVHLLTLVLVYFALILPLAEMQFRFAELLTDAREVGPSAGYYGCFGFAVCGASQKVKWSLVAVIFVVLLGRLLFSGIALYEHPHFVIGDVAHLIAFPFGLLAGKLIAGTARAVENSQDKGNE